MIGVGGPKHLGGSATVSPSNVKILTSEKDKPFEGQIFLIHAFIHKVLVQNVHRNIKLRNSRGRIDVAVRCSTRW